MIRIQCDEIQKEAIIQAIGESNSCLFGLWEGASYCMQYEDCFQCVRNEIEWSPEGESDERVAEDQV